MGFKPLTLFIGFLFVLFSFSSLQAQDNLVVEYDGALGLPDFLNICGEADTARMTVRITGLEIEARENIVATVNLFQGVQFVEFLSAESDAGVTMVSSGLNTATFTVPDLDPFITTNVDLVFTLKADCSYVDTINANNQAAVFDTWDLTYDLDGSSLAETEATAEYKDAFAVPNLTISNTNNVTISSIGECFDRDLILSNSGLSGFIDSIEYSATYGPGISVTALSVNGVTFPLVKTPVGTDTLYEAILSGTFMELNTLGMGMGDGDQSLDPDESLVVTESICVISCDEDRSSIHNVSWGCYGAVCETETITNFVTIGSGAPSAVATNSGTIANEITGYCQDGTQTVTFTNSGNEIDPGYGTMRDVELGIGLGNDFLLDVNMFEIFSVTVAGVTLTTTDALIRLDDFTEFQVDPDGPGGLMDFDGDGYFDDLPINESIEITVGYRFVCSEANSTDDNCENPAAESLHSQILYTNSCAERILVENNSVIRPSNITPDSESSTDTDAMIATETFHIQYFQLRTVSNFAKACSGDERMVVTVDLPTGVMIDFSETNLFRNTSIPLPLVTSSTTGTITEMVFDASISNFISGSFTVDLGITSDCTADPGPLTVPVTLAHYCPDCDCTHTWFCGDLDGPVLHPSVPPCTNLPPCPNGVRALDFDVERTTFGYTDETYTTQVDASTANLDVALSCDSVMMTVTSVVGDDVITDDVGVIITYDNPEEIAGLDEIFLFDGAEVEIRQLDGTISTCNVAATAITVTAVDLNKTLDIELDDCLAGLGLTLSPNDTIIFKGMFSLNPDGPYNEQFKLIPNFRGEMYHTFGGDQLSCDNFGEVFTVAKTGSLFTFPSTPSFPEGCKESDLDYKVTVFSNDFGVYYPNEFIPAAFVDSLKFTFDPAILDAFEDLLVEVKIPNHPVHGNDFFPIQGLDAFPGGEYLAVFDTLNYIPSYNTATSAVFTLRLNLVANCGSETASSNGDNLFTFVPEIFYRDRVYAETIGDGSCAEYVNESVNNNILYTEAPTFSLQALSNPNPQVMTDTVQWVLQHCNTSTESDGGLNWVAFEIPNTSVVIESITDISTGLPVDVPFTAYGATNSVFAYVDPLLRNFSGNAPEDICNTYIVVASFNECGTFPVNATSGWNCTPYDEVDWTPELYAPCAEVDVDLTVTTLEGALDAEVLSQATDSVSLCDTLTYEILVRNTDLGNVFDMENQIFLPLLGLDFVPNSFELAYPPSSPFSPIGDPLLLDVSPNGETYGYNDFDQISTFLDENGLQGFNAAAPTDSNEYVIRFKIVPNCRFISGRQIPYSFQGVSACGDSTNVEFGETFPIFIEGVPEPTQFFLAEFGSGSTYDPSGTGTLEVSVSNITGELTDNNDVIRVILPIGSSYIPNSVMANLPTGWVPGEPSMFMENGFNVLYWNMPQGVPQAGEINFTFDFTGNPIPVCDTDTLSFNLFTMDRYDIFCGVSGETCTIFAGTTEGGAQDLDLIVTNGITLTIANTTSDCIDDTTEEITVNANIEGLPVLPQDGPVQFFYDSDMNGVGEIGTDVLLAEFLIPAGSSGSVDFSETFNVTNTQLCNLLMSFDTTGIGACNLPAPQVITPELQNAGTSSNYCGNSITIGENGCAGINTFTYLWSAVSPATIADISDVNILTPTLTVDPSIPVGSTLQYVLETTRGGCGFSSTDTIEITVLDDLTVSIDDGGGVTTSSSVCNGSSNTLTANASEAVTYQWTDGTNDLGTNQSITINPTTATTYTVVVTNTGGCTVSETVDVTIDSGFTSVDAGTGTTICLGASTQLQGTATGGTGNITYSWTGAGLDDNSIANPIATPTVTTTYTLTVMDEDGCSDTDDVTITVDTDVPAVSVGTTDICVGLNTVLTATGGTNFTWTELAANPASSTLSALNIANPTFTPTVAGTYNFEVFVEGGCDDITVPVSVTVSSIQVTNGQNLDQCLGDIQPVSITLEENIQSYTINSGSAQNESVNGATLTFDAVFALGNNSFSIEFEGVSGCTVVETFEFVDCSCVPTLVAGTLVANSNCGESVGSATITITGNPADYTFTWLPNTGVASGNGESRTDLSAGTYQVTIEENGNPGCITTTTVVIGNSDGPEPTDITTTPATCANPDGTATILPADWTYEWSDGGNGNVRTDLISGIYGVTVTDPADPSCTNVIMVVIQEDNDLVVDHVINNAPTCGNTDGDVDIVITGGSGNYTFIWSDGGTGSSRNNLSSGTYLVNITEVGGDECSTSYIFALVDSDVPQATVTIDDVIDVLCPDEANGGVDFTVNLPGGIVNPVDTVITDGFTEWTNGTLIAGQYCIEIRDANGCVNGAACFEIESPEPLISTISTNAACGDGGNVDIEVMGGTGIYTFDWADIPGTSNPKNRANLPAGNYDLTISDSNGCSMTLDGGITIDACGCTVEPSIESAIIHESTCNNADGEVELLVNPTTAGLTYTWSPDIGVAAGDGSIRKGLPAGGYTVTVSDATGECFDIITFAITNSDGPELDGPVVVAASDCGMTNGTATFTPATLNYNWSDGGTGNSRNDLAAGTYFVSVSEQGNINCFTLVEVNIESISDIEVDVQVTNDPTCGNADGTVMANTTGGSGTYNYEWSFGGTGNATETNIQAGIYAVTVSDSNSPECENSNTFLLVDSDIPGVDVTIDNITNVGCGGENNGAVEFTVTPQAGFQGPETIIISDGNSVFTNGSLPGGNYCFAILDANGCVAGGDCFVIEENETLVAEFSISSGCGNEGEIDVIVSNGTGIYTYDWADLPGTDDPEDRDNLSPGFYSVTVTDSDGCTMAGIDLSVLCSTCELDLDLESVVIVESTCGEDTGEATINTDISLGALEFTWTPDVGTPGITDNIRTNLPAGGYIVSVVDTTGFCMDEIIFVVTNSDGPELDADPVTTAADCNANNGTATLSPNTFNYAWSDGGTGDTRNDLSAGAFFVTITDPADPTCTGIVEVNVDINITLEVVINATTLPTCGNNDGAIEAIVTNGSGNYTYSWSFGGTAATETGLSSGTYVVEVIDNDNPSCIATAAIVLQDSDVANNFDVTINNTSNISCQGINDGSVDFAVTPNTGFTAVITNGFNTFQNGSLPEGEYCVNIIDDNGCVAGGACFTIEENESLEAEFSISGGCADDGNIALTITGGTGIYTYDWSDLPGTDDPADRTDLPQGLYEVTITDENGCTIQGLNLSVNCDNCDFEPEILSTTMFEATCGNSDGEVILNLNVDPSQVIYTWSPDLGTEGATGNIRTGLPAGGYTVVVSDPSGGCTSMVTFALTNEDAPDLDNDPVVTPADCGVANGTATLSPSTYTYTWSDGGTGDARTDLMAGTYFVSFTDADPNCEGVVEITIESNSTLEVAVNVDTAPTCGNSDGAVTATVTNGSGNYEYQWSFGGNNASETGIAGGTYMITVTDIDNPACTASAPFILIDGDAEAVTVTLNSTSNISCAGSEDGSIDFIINPTAGFSTVITDGINIYENGSIPSGDFCLEIRDANGCVAGGECFTIEEAPVLDVEFSISGGCNEDGAIDVRVNGGTGVYTFDWLDIAGEDNDEDRANLTTGVYSVIVSDENGCSVLGFDLPIECESCDGNIIDYTISFESLCGTSIGSAEVVVNGTATDYEYTWTPAGIGNLSDDGSKLTQLPAGVYQVVIQDTTSVSCVDSVSILVTNEDGPEATIVSTTPSLCGEATGTAVLTPDTLVYEWSDGGTGEVRNDLVAGIYEVIYHEDGDTVCYNVLLVEIQDTVATVMEVDITQQPDCNTANGIATINITGGSGTFSFLWSDGGTGQTRSDLESGTYTVIATDETTGCTDEITFTITDNITASAVIAISEINGINCNGEGQGSVVFTVNYLDGFAQPAVVTITDGFTQYSAASLPVGSYCINVTDADGCLVTAECFDIRESDELELSIIGTYAGCEGSGDLGSFDVTVMGGTTPYTFDWADLNDAVEPEDRTDLAAGSYGLTITDANGCMAIADNIQLDTFCISECEYFNDIDTLTMELMDCGDTILVCAGITFSDFLLGDYTITIDGNEYEMDTEDACESDVISGYIYVLIPGQGNAGPYTVDSWTVDGIVYTGEVEDLQGLVDSMNAWNPEGSWMVDAATGTIQGGDLSMNYGDMVIFPTNNPFVSATLNFNVGQSVSSLGLEVSGAGIHEVVIINNETLCPDTMIVDLVCMEYTLTDSITLGDSIFFCLDVNEIIANTDLEGNIVSLENGCPDESGESVIFNIESEDPPCISYLGITPGVDTACLVFCDDMGICDTVNYIVTVSPTGPLTVTDTIIISQVDTFCLDSLTNLCGEIQSVTNFCDDGSTEVIFEIIQTDDDFCVVYEGVELGIDSACLEVTDEYGNTDTVTIVIEVVEITSDTICDTIFVGQIVQYCIDTSQLLAPVESISNVCLEESGEFVEFFMEDGSWCVTYEGVDDVGMDSACIVVCDEVGICDTTFFCISVVEFFDPPIAVDDVDSTFTNVPVVINVKENDTIFGGIDTIFVLEEPFAGEVTINLDCTFTYDPDDGVCSVTDSFTYVVCNPNACDTATVFIHIECTGLTIFNGFSPNGDGVNDVFYIDGIEDFPNNRLCIYNRWGEKVYEKDGYNNEWQGDWSGYDLPDGTYFYVLDLGEDASDIKTLYNGYLHIFR